ncbi:nitrate reductase molybdenum cofactor assembly chaperone [Sphingopyxis sp. SE2]|uniref:nitrate reductase molybdenum cofactor assembly chaperone n=1 Tax=Sphingopyxis sp. SE2 TaxID=1586240 RepID=UPI0028C34B47|nr:nitrate reductase molybdenum cofactor assembly chaperone [Sphingopyxis sp. SE2]MDT7527772.1 nitrate reductase molybdenum cofactor assembly chaperone [Sphingopyxis sp. SE2]
MRMTLRALAALLGYPSEELKDNIGEVRSAMAAESALGPAMIQRLEPLLQSYETDDLLDLQADYSELFDRSRKLSLHLFEHVHGDNRERGQAMIDLGGQYASAGFFLETTELPDFIPVFLEFCSGLPVEEAREMLDQPAHVFAALAERLDERDKRFGAIFHAILAAADVRPGAEALAELQENTPEDDPAKIDEEWEEAPVTFTSGGAHEMGGPTGVVAKIRAANRAVKTAIKG